MNYTLPTFGILSISALMVFLFTTGNSSEINRKKVVLISFLFSILIVLTGFLGAIRMIDAFYSFLIVFGINVLTGFFFALYIGQYEMYMDKPMVSKLLLSFFITCLGFVGYIFIYNYVSRIDIAIHFAWAAIGFLVPVWLMESYYAYIAIPNPVYFEWKYNEDLDLEPFRTDDIMMVTFDMPMNMDASVRKEIKLKAPKSVIFGDFFHFFIEQYNANFHQEQIQYKNFNGEPYSWSFYIKPQGFFGSKQIIDPRESIADNKLNQNNIITIERLVK